MEGSAVGWDWSLVIGMFGSLRASEPEFIVIGESFLQVGRIVSVHTWSVFWWVGAILEGLSRVGLYWRSCCEGVCMVSIIRCYGHYPFSVIWFLRYPQFCTSRLAIQIHC